MLMPVTATTRGAAIFTLNIDMPETEVTYDFATRKLPRLAPVFVERVVDTPLTESALRPTIFTPIACAAVAVSACTPQIWTPVNVDVPARIEHMLAIRIRSVVVASAGPKSSSPSESSPQSIPVGRVNVTRRQAR
eukprot:CAMPEP_0180054680 /NCGR_PEP_ID=MMETSP0985-20121206/2954_1 /TAXON_ID=483367 /ORGANISM="non described non described, Strain CCMP 2436" /LENGTH=134 /DNA_ID=CAMNT_0021984285 /DNA_START=137 /DNA_END=537 /DNA_ORIENTATION=+